MTDDRLEGAVRNGVGHVQDAVGGLTGDTRTQAQGKLNQVAGSVQDVVGQARERVADAYDDVEGFAKEQPVTALAITLGLGVVIGLMLRGGRKTVYLTK